MLRIISDTSTMYSTTQAREAGFDVAALSVTIAGKSYREFDDIDSQAFVDIINQGHMPTSSQPAIGEVIDLFEKYPEDEIINITMAQGLSGTYDSALSALENCSNKDKITVINSRTLCGPHRYMVEMANKMAHNGMSKAEIMAWLEKRIETAKSYLLPADFDYLRRGGRLSPLVSYVGKTIKLHPVMTQTDDGKKLSMAGVKRSYKQAIQLISNALEKRGVGKGWIVYITHAGAENLAKEAVEIIRKDIPEARFEVYPLSPAFITQGGPGCVAVQVVEA